MMSLLIALLGCAVAPETSPYQLQVTVEPDPPAVGDALLTVETDAESMVLEGTMRGMGHGFPSDPVVTPTQTGTWTATVEFSMSGTWDLSFSLDGSEGPATMSWSLDVQ